MNVLIACPLEPQFAAALRTLDDVNDVLYEPDLLAQARYPNDHSGEPLTYSAEQQRRWHAAVARADVLFGYPDESSAGLRRVLEAGPNIRFVQGTSAGMGAHVKRAQLPAATLERVTFASAAGVHAGMLAEFAFYGLLALRKDARRLAQMRTDRAWHHYAMGELDGSTIAILGLGQIGVAIATRSRAFGMHTIGLTRSGVEHPAVDQTYPTTELAAVAGRVDALAITLPMTDLTTGMLNADVMAALRPHAVLINVGRGSVVDEPALIAALTSGRIAGAVLDVFATEPLPSENPLWTLPNVIFSPHTAALSLHENARIVALFADNLQRLQRGEPLRNALNLIEFY